MAQELQDVDLLRVELVAEEDAFEGCSFTWIDGEEDPT